MISEIEHSRVRRFFNIKDIKMAYAVATSRRVKAKDQSSALSLYLMLLATLGALSVDAKESKIKLGRGELDANVHTLNLGGYPGSRPGEFGEDVYGHQEGLATVWYYDPKQKIPWAKAAGRVFDVDAPQNAADFMSVCTKDVQQGMVLAKTGVVLGVELSSGAEGLGSFCGTYALEEFREEEQVRIKAEQARIKAERDAEVRAREEARHVRVRADGDVEVRAKNTRPFQLKHPPIKRPPKPKSSRYGGPR